MPIAVGTSYVLKARRQEDYRDPADTMRAHIESVKDRIAEAQQEEADALATVEDARRRIQRWSERLPVFEQALRTLEAG